MRTRDFAERGTQGDRMYAIGGYADVRVAGVNGSADTQGDATAWGVGYDTSLGANTLAGGSLASEHVPLELVGGGRLRFEQRGLTVYVAHRYGAAYTSAHAAFGSLDYASQRDAHIGPMTATEHAEFTGRFKAAGLGAGYRFGDAKFSHGPFVTVDWRRVEINGFSEGNSATAIAVGSQKGERTSAEVGYRLAADSLFGKADTRPYAELAWRRDRNDDREVSVGTGSTGTVMPVSMPGDSGSGGRISFGVNTKLSEKVELGVGANFASGGPQGRDASLNVQFSAGF
jgi:outer membrane lipase/esterase